MILNAVGRGKLILFGEHSAVWGHPAVGLPLPYRLHLQWSDSETGTSPRSQTGLTGNDRQTFKDLLLRLPDDFSFLRRGNWAFSGNVPRFGGFGSSAALCTALARTALKFSGERYDISVHRLANELESRFHTTPSGIDTGMASDVTPAVWHPVSGDVPEREPLSVPEGYFLLGAVPRRQDTAASVGNIRTGMETGESRTCEAIRELGDIAGEFIRLCKSPTKLNADKVDFARATGILADKSQAQLAELGLSTPELDQIIGEAKNRGSLGGKMSGGGAGGAFWLIFPDSESRARYLETYNESGNRSLTPNQALSQNTALSRAEFLKELTTGI